MHTQNKEPDSAGDLLPKELQNLRQNYMDSPATVSIETYTQCNARCSFCPIADLPRLGNRMETRDVLRLIDEIAAFPKKPITINLSRVNEPFLDERIWEFSETINQRIPDAGLVYFSNGHCIDSKTIERLGSIQRVNFLNISLNETHPDKYRKLMRVPFERVMRNLNRLHEAKTSKEIHFPVRISRVEDGSSGDQAFVEWVGAHFPLFKAFVQNRSDWMGAVSLTHTSSTKADAFCPQWFKLHILSDGSVAFCCIDSHGQKQRPGIHQRSLLEIYNHPAARFIRERVSQRKTLPQCRGCNL